MGIGGKIAKGAVKGAADIVKGVFEGGSDIYKEYIAPKLGNFKIKTNSKGEKIIVPTEPINISLVAPSRVGKSTIISSVMYHLTHGGVTNSKIDVIPDPSTENTLNESNKEVDRVIGEAGHGLVEVGKIEEGGTQNAEEFNFTLSAKINIDTGAKAKVEQSFHIVDYPGGWLSNKHAAGYDDFSEHLTKSRILWVPIEAPYLMQAKTQTEKGSARTKLEIGNVGELVNKWALSRKEADENCCIFFAPVKCETYSKKRNEKKHEELKKAVLEKYDDEVIKKLKDTLQDLISKKKCDIFYVPVETIGCIVINSSEWDGDELKVEYSKVEGGRSVKGIDALLHKVFEYANSDIENKLTAEMRAIKDRKVFFLNFLGKIKQAKDKKEMESMLNAFFTVKDEIRNMGSSGSKYDDMERWA